MELTITKIGDASGIILPPDLLEKLQVENGDRIYVTNLSDGVKISSRDSDFEKVMMCAERVMEEDVNVLRRLAE